MGIKFLKILGVMILLLSLTACPGEEDCMDIGSIARVNDLITITPLKPTYTTGETISFKLEIPSTNTFFGEQIDIFQNTGDMSALLTVSYGNLFDGNSLTFVTGSQSNNNNWFNVLYNSDSNTYILELNIKLNKNGIYELNPNDNVLFQGSSKCNRYRLDTTPAGRDSENKISFTVE
jgi:hypothetical protein